MTEQNNAAVCRTRFLTQEMPQPPFEALSPRIALRPMEYEDCEAIVRWRNNERVREHYVYRERFTLEGQRRYFHDKVEKGLVWQYMICERARENRPIGCMVFTDWEPDKNQIEYGLFIGEDDAAGKGYGTEAIRLGMTHAFRRFGVGKVVCRIFTDNLPSLASNEKAGYRRAELLRGVACSDGEKKDMWLLEITPSLVTGRPLVSFVLPCYRSEKTLPAVVAEIDGTMERLGTYRTQIVMVCDGSPDDTWGTIRRLCAACEGRVGFNFAKNFGQHAALMAGLRQAQGDYVVCLDDDGQTPAGEVGGLLAALEAGADVVYADYGGHKQHSFFRNLGTAMNEAMTYALLGKPRELFVSSYFAMRRFVAQEVCRYRNAYPYLIGLVLRTTKNIVNVPVTHRRRESGQSGYTFGKLLALWLNGFTAFSIKPLRIATAIGAFCAAGGILYGIYTVLKKLFNPAVPVGFSALMSAIVFFGGMTLLMLGLAGEYIGRTYICVNDAPQYVVRESAGETAPEKGNGAGDSRHA